jgi:hypothetical protein
MSDKPEQENIIKSAAKVIGSAVGKVAAVTGVRAASAAKPQSGKLPRKNKARLPRREKKKLAHAHNKA